MFVYGFKEVFDKVTDYNKRIERLIWERRNYMDSVMEEISPFKIGDEYVYVKTGERTKNHRELKRFVEEFHPSLGCIGWWSSTYGCNNWRKMHGLPMERRTRK